MPRDDEPLQVRETLTFKQVDGLELEADIYYPRESHPQQCLPIALMIHGGGHIMLSRADVRPEQTQMLISRGFLPISIDYRLCPEMTLPEGPMQDVADALIWIRNTLPNIQLQRPDIHVDGKHVVAVGWSTGGTLAMSLAWNSVLNGTQPPNAIFALYCPSDYEDPFWRSPNVPEGSKTAARATVDLDDTTWAGVFEQPVKAYNVPARKGAVGGWLAPSDARSRVALYMNHQGRTLHTLLRGLDRRNRDVPHGSEALSAAEIGAVSPLAQIRCGRYRTPTFILHPREDDLIPWQQAERTDEALKIQGIPVELRIVNGVPHLFDVYRNWQRNEAALQAISEGYDFLLHHVTSRKSK